MVNCVTSLKWSRISSSPSTIASLHLHQTSVTQSTQAKTRCYHSTDSCPRKEEGNFYFWTNLSCIASDFDIWHSVSQDLACMGYIGYNTILYTIKIYTHTSHTIPCVYVYIHPASLHIPHVHVYIVYINNYNLSFFPNPYSSWKSRECPMMNRSRLSTRCDTEGAFGPGQVVIRRAKVKNPGYLFSNGMKKWKNLSSKYK